MIDNEFDYTVIGYSGFIGGNIAKYLEKLDYKVLKIGRNIESIEDYDNVGIVIYCAGYGDCNKEALNVIDANVTQLTKILHFGNYKKLIYISSSRVYVDNEFSNEDDDLLLKNNDSRRLFNLSKLMVEALLDKFEDTISLRVSNVYGDAYDSNLFLPSIIRDAINKNEINMYISKNYAKDYINILDVCDVIYKVSKIDKLQSNKYNVASGYNVNAETIVELIQRQVNTKVFWHSFDKEDSFPVIDISRIKNEIDFKPRRLNEDIKLMIDIFLGKFSNNE